MEKFRLRITGDIGFEFWADIEGYEGLYQVSTYGRIKSLERKVNGGNNIRTVPEKILKARIDKYGYLYLLLSKNSIEKTFKVHRLVAQAYLPKFYTLCEVNHINENKVDNNVENLEWCTAKYNVNYGSRNKRVADKNRNGKKSKAVLQFDLKGNFIKEFPSGMEIERSLGYKQNRISDCCLGKLESYSGFIWKYKKEVE